jgi:hypothetical protein
LLKEFRSEFKEILIGQGGDADDERLHFDATLGRALPYARWNFGHGVGARD